MEGVAGQDDARPQRDVVAGEALRVAGAVPVLVAGEHDRARAGQGGHRLHDPRAVLWVPAHDRPLLVGERTGLVEDPRRNADLADVMERRGDADVAQGDVAQIQPAADLLGHPDERLGVVAGVLVLGLERVRQRPHRGQERRLELVDERAVVDGEQRLIGDAEQHPLVADARRAPPAAALDDDHRPVPGPLADRDDRVGGALPGQARRRHQRLALGGVEHDDAPRLQVAAERRVGGGEGHRLHPAAPHGVCSRRAPPARNGHPSAARPTSRRTRRAGRRPGPASRRPPSRSPGWRAPGPARASPPRSRPPRASRCRGGRCGRRPPSARRPPRPRPGRACRTRARAAPRRRWPRPRRPHPASARPSWRRPRRFECGRPRRRGRRPRRSRGPAPGRAPRRRGARRAPSRRPARPSAGRTAASRTGPGGRARRPPRGRSRPPSGRTQAGTSATAEGPSGPAAGRGPASRRRPRAPPGRP